LRIAQISCALLIVTIGLLGLALVPRQAPSPPASAGPRTIPPAVGPGAPPRSDVSDSGRQVVGTTFRVLEQDSPAIDARGKLTQAIGIERPRGTLMPFLMAGAVQPAMEARTYGTANPEQTQILLHIVRGNSERIIEDHSLGWIRLTGFRAGPNGKAAVAVALRVADGNIVLAAVDVSTRQPVVIEPIESPISPTSQ
jgi:hypothetical protein